MRALILIALIASPLYAHAGLWKRICSAIVADDPRPYAEEPAGELLELYRLTRSTPVLTELLERYEFGGLTDEQRYELEYAIGYYGIRTGS